MKKLYTTPEYKRKHKRRLTRLERRRRDGRSRQFYVKIAKEETKKVKILLAPKDLRLLGNTEEVLGFFRVLRSSKYVTQYAATYRSPRVNLIELSLEDVEKIDHAAISVLTAISDDMKDRKVILKVNRPRDRKIIEFISESGFLDHMLDLRGQPFRKAPKSDLIIFEKGGRRLSDSDIRKISLTVKTVIFHLGGNRQDHQMMRNIVLEICGNSIEWSGTENRLWLFGVKYEDDNRVIFTLTDIGRGILDTLHISKLNMVTDWIYGNDSLEVLKQAFNRKYGSTTMEVNRNKGLPAIKYMHDLGRIQNLKLITNNVILKFDDEESSGTLPPDNSFDGTFYEWVVTPECIKKQLPE